MPEPMRGHSVGRRRFLLAALAFGTQSIVAACQQRLPLSAATPSASTAPARRVQPLADATPPAAPSDRLDVDFAGIVRLEGVSIEQEPVRPGDFLRVWLYWQAIGDPTEDLRSMGELVGPNGRTVGREDDQIGPRGNQLRRWRRGDRVVDEMRIRVAPNSPSGEYSLGVAVLRPDNQTRVPLTSPHAALAFSSEDAVLVKTIEVG
ncbi:MAG: hypothetical protein H0V51_06325 [Chloroflexi bacterium]|nr:hypothetical protein [Chloroflexota bacterium]